jgi:abortive infection bacteriophage resistance protein
MRYLREHHKIKISGVAQKRMLRNIGYYHGYKGYRYANSHSNHIPYKSFQEIMAINKFDMGLKSLFYPQLMFIETALKNYVLEEVISQSGSANFNDIFNDVLTAFKSYPSGNQRKETIKQRIALRSHVFSTLSANYSNKSVISHFYNKGENVPIWAIFEIISLGEFGRFVQCLNIGCRKNISYSLRLNQSCDSSGHLTANIIYTIKDLRNAVAHNEIIFDTRFKTGGIRKGVSPCLEIDTGIANIRFRNIVDYLILIVYLLKQLGVSKTELRQLISGFETASENLRDSVPFSIHSQVLLTDTKNKLTSLREFIKK